jgi:hypothetical protein
MKFLLILTHSDPLELFVKSFGLKKDGNCNIFLLIDTNIAKPIWILPPKRMYLTLVASLLMNKYRPTHIKLLPYSIVIY